MSKILKTFLKYAATQKEPSKGLSRAVNKAWSEFVEETGGNAADAADLQMDSTLIKLGLAKKVKDKETKTSSIQYKGVS